MNEANKSRGPDDTGCFVDDEVSLGQNRLAIIDLSVNGHQPMANEDGSVWIVYNGEIYNFKELRKQLIALGHHFKSETDSEVILHAYEQYGPDCQRYFNGMWAFCIYDKKKNILCVGRDQFGIKPLYFRMDDRNIVLSSTISGLLCHQHDEPNSRAIMEYLAYNIEDYNDETFFLHVKRLLPGHTGVYDLQTRTLDITDWRSENPQPMEKEMNAQNLRDMFIECVKMRTISDVPIGACLSGGIDSSSIVAIMGTLLKQSFHSFSLVAPGYRRDESKYIDIVGKNVDLVQYRTEIEEKKFYDDIIDFIICQEEPVTGMGPFAQYEVMKLAHEHGAKVLLDGQGGDEILGGYTYYFSYFYLDLLRRMRMVTLVKELLSDLIRNEHQNNLYPITLWGFLTIPDSCKFGVWSATLDSWINKQYLVDICSREGDLRWYVKTMDDIQKMSLEKTAIPEMLRYEDKNSMRFGIESRVPFLDPKLVEYCKKMSMSQRISNGVTKTIFREAMRDIVPEEILSRRDKIGFESRTDDFFRQPHIVELCSNIFKSDMFRSRPYWIPDNVMDLLSDHCAGKIQAGDKLWKILTTELWLRLFFEDPQSEPYDKSLDELLKMGETSN